MTAALARKARRRARLSTGPLGIRNFRLLAGGQFASTIGDYCYAVALPWLVLSGNGGPARLGAVLACYGIPRTVLIPVGGVLADKIGHRTLMLIADTVRCVLLIALTFIATRHTVSLAALAPTAALIGAGQGVFLPASYSILPAMLDPGQLAAGNALSSALIQAGSLIGPAIGGALVAATRGSTAAFAVDAASFAISALTLALISPAADPEGRPASEPNGRPASEPKGRAASEPEGAMLPGLRSDERSEGATREGSITKRPQVSEQISTVREQISTVRELIKGSRPLQLLLLVGVVANLTSGGLGEVALPTLAHQHYGPGGYGALLACLAAGSVLGTLAAARAGNLARPVVVIATVDAVMCAALAMVPYAGGEAGAAGAILLFGAGNGLGNILALTLVQRMTPHHLLGKLMGVLMLSSYGMFPLSVAIGGILVRHLGAAPFFPIAAACIAFALFAGITQRDLRDYGATSRTPL